MEDRLIYPTIPSFHYKISIYQTPLPHYQATKFYQAIILVQHMGPLYNIYHAKVIIFFLNKKAQCAKTRAVFKRTPTFIIRLTLKEKKQGDLMGLILPFRKEVLAPVLSIISSCKLDIVVYKSQWQFLNQWLGNLGFFSILHQLYKLF